MEGRGNGEAGGGNRVLSRRMHHSRGSLQEKGVHQAIPAGQVAIPFMPVIGSWLPVPQGSPRTWPVCTEGH